MTSEYGTLFKEPSKTRSSWPVLMASEKFAEDLEKRREKTKHTPDLLKLQLRRGHLIFVYNNLKAGFPNHHILDRAGAKFVAMGVTHHLYTLFYQPDRKDERFPILLMPKYAPEHQGHVVGQVWMVYPETIIELDRLQWNRDLFIRSDMNIQLVSKPKNKSFQQYATIFCQTYFGAPDQWEGLVKTKDLTPIPRTKLFNEGDTERFLNWNTKHADTRF